MVIARKNTPRCTLQKKTTVHDNYMIKQGEGQTKNKHKIQTFHQTESPINPIS